MKRRIGILGLIVVLVLSSCVQTKAASQEEKTMEWKLYLTIDGKTVSATMVDNSSTRALREKLAVGPVTYEAHDYGGFEKVGDLPWSLPRNDQDIDTTSGDLILYLGRSLCIYYGQNSWDFTRLGTLDGMKTEDLKAFVSAGKGNVKVTLSLDSALL